MPEATLAPLPSTDDLGGENRCFPRAPTLIAVATLIALVASSGCDRNASGPKSANEIGDEATAEEPESEEDNASAADGPDEEASAAADPEPTAASNDGSRLWAGSTGDNQVTFEPGDVLDDRKLDEAFEQAGERTRTIPYAMLKEADPSALDAVDVLTSSGPVRLSIEEVRRDGRPEGFAYQLQTETSEALGDQPDWVLVSPAGRMAESARMKPAEAHPIHQKAAPKLRQALLGELEADERKRVAAKVNSDHMEVVGGRFPDPHDQFATVTVPGGPGSTPLVRAIYLLEDTGEVSATVDEPFVGALGGVEVLGVADPDADGIDGVLFEVRSDGYFIRWLDFDADGDPVVETLSGFAA